MASIEERAKELAFSSYHESIRGTIKNVYIYAANEQRKIDIEKVCEWLEKHTMIDLEIFKKAMEEQDYD